MTVKRIILNRIMTIALTVVLSVCAVGCGRNNKKNDSVEQGVRYSYVPTIYSIDDANDPNVSYYNFNAREDGIYYVRSEYGKDYKLEQCEVIRRNMYSGETEKIPVDTGHAEINAMTFDAEGNMVFLCAYINYDEDYNIVDSDYYILKTDRNGKELLHIDVNEVMRQNEGFAFASVLQVGPDGLYYLCDRDHKIIAVNEQGEVRYTLTGEDYIMSFYMTSRGQLVTIQQSMNSGTFEIFAKTIDTDAGSWGRTYKNIPESYSQGTLGIGPNDDLIIPSETAVFGYNLNGPELTEYLNYMDYDLIMDSIQAIHMMENGDVTLVNWNYSAEKVELILLRRVEAGAEAEKITLTIGGINFSEEIKQHVVEFNKANPDYRIKLIEYAGGNTDYETAEINMNAAVASGNGADMYVINTPDMGRKYASKGLLVDLNQFIANDPEIRKEDYFENILTMYSYNGLCYGLMPQFWILTLVARTSDVGDKTRWTPEDVIELLKDNPDKCFAPHMRKQDLMLSLISKNMDQYVNWETGECHFDSQEFIDILELANTAKSENEHYDEDEGMAFYRNEALANEYYIGDIDDIQLGNRLYREPVTYIGYPTQKEYGNMIVATGSSIAISSKCTAPDVAWSFVRYFILPEAQNRVGVWGYNGFPVLKSALADYLEAEMTPEYYTNEQGEQVESLDQWNVDGISIQIGAVTEEERDTLYYLIEHSNCESDYDVQMYSMISEEASAYFDGDKSAKDVAAIIQNRVSLYVKENQ